MSQDFRVMLVQDGETWQYEDRTYPSAEDVQAAVTEAREQWPEANLWVEARSERWDAVASFGGE